MNKTYKVVWNESLGTWCAISETSKARGKRSTGKAIVASAVIVASTISGMTLAADNYVSVNDGGTQSGNYNNDGAIASGSVVIGPDSSSIGASGVAIGNNADVTGLQGVAIGNNAQAGYQSMALGHDAIATAFNSMALGGNSIAYTDGTALGQGTYANKLATAMGNGSLAVGLESTAYGYSALAGTDSFSQPSAGTDPDTIGKAYATAMGSRAKASAQGSTALGARSGATGISSVAIGEGSTASNDFSVAIGSSSTATMKGAIAIGDGAFSGGKDAGASIVIGGAIEKSDYAPALNGARNDESAQASIVIGSGATNKGAIATVIGTGASAGVEGGSTVIGSFASSTTSGTALGGSAKVIGRNGTAVGLEAVAYNDGVALGTLSVANRNAGTLGYDPSSKSIAVTGSHIASLSGIMSAVSIGDTDKKIYRQITNVAAGTVDTDAVNVAQLKAVQAATETHYVSVNDGGVQSSNYNNDGAIGLNSIAVGANAQAIQENAVSVGAGAQSGLKSVSIGSNVGSLKAEGSIAIGSSGNGSVGGSSVGTGTSSEGYDHIAIGTESGIGVKGNNNLALGGEMGNNVIGSRNTAFGGEYSGSNVVGDENIVLGSNAGNNITANRTLSIGSTSKASADDTIAIGTGAQAAVTGSVALGSGSQAIRNVGNETAYIPVGTAIVGANAVGGEVSVGAIGRERRITNVAAASQDTDAVNLSQLKAAQAAATTHYLSVNDGGVQSGNYNNDGATGKNSIAIGIGSKAENENSVSIGTNATSNYGSVAIGSSTIASNGGSTAIGTNNVALANNAHIIGRNNRSEQQNSSILGNENQILTSSGTSLAIGNNNILTSGGAAALGFGNQVSGASTLALGTGNNVANINTTAVGLGNQVLGNGSTVLGTDNTVGSDSSGILGRYNQVNNGSVAYVLGQANNVSGRSSAVVGVSNTVKNNNTFVLGNSITTTQDNSIILGNESSDRAATTVDKVTINGEDYTVAGAGSAANGIVSVGKAGGERQVINVAAGEVSATSTDAVNGSQLFATNKAIADSQTHYVSVSDGGVPDTNYNNDGAVGSYAVAVGVGAKAQGTFSSAIGLGATTGTASVALGERTGSANTGNSIAIGNAGDGSVAGRNFGTGALSSGVDLVAIGTEAGMRVNGSDNVAIGGEAGNDVRGERNLGLGTAAGSRANGVENIALGFRAGNDIQANRTLSIGSTSKASADDAIAIGTGAQSESYKGLAIGVGATVAAGGNDSIAIGSGAQAAAGRAVVIGLNAGVGNINDGDANVLIGMNAGQNNDGRWNTAVGSNSGYNTKGQRNTALGDYSGHDVTGNGNIGLGGSAGNSVIGETNLAVGASAGGSVVGSHNTALGRTAGVNVTGDLNTATGLDSGSTVLGNDNVAYGRGSGNQIKGSNNSAVGGGSGYQVSGNYNATLAYGSGAYVTGNANTAIGFVAGNKVNGDSNIAIGGEAGSRVNGSRNVALGLQAGQDLDNVNDATSLGSGAKAAVSGSVALGSGSQAIRNVGNETAYIPVGTTIAGANAAGGEVSVGTIGRERRITNVAAASQDTDAVNLSQLKAAQAAATTHYLSVNDDGTQGGNYNNDGAQGKNSLALGVGAKATGENAIAIGNVSTDAANSIAIGNNNVLSNTAGASTVIGSNNNVTGNEAVALGSNNTVKDFSGVAVGSYNRAFGYRSITVGAENQTDGQWSSAIGLWNIAGGERATALGANNKILARRALGVGVVNEISSASEYSSAIGAFNKITDSTKSLAAGFSNTITGGDNNNVLGNENQLNNAKNSTAIGNKNIVAQDNTQVLGNNVTTTQANSVVLGNESTDRAATSESKVSINGQDYAFAGVGSASNGVVSVGKAGAERQIINVAAGKVSSDSTDAVNGSQLYATNQAITEVGKSAAAAKTEVVEGDNIVVTETQGKNGQSIYNVATAKEVSFNKTTVGTVITDSATGKITGLTAGEVSATSTDAINGSQLYATNKAIADSKTHYVSVNDDGVQADNYNNDGATGKNALAVGVGSKAAGENAVVIGYNNNVAQDKTVALGSSITTTQANSVVLGNESTDRAATSESKVSINGQDYAFAGVGSASNGVVSVGKAGAERQIINVAAGKVSSDSTDAVNGSQLYATNQAITEVGKSAAAAKTEVVEGDNIVVTETQGKNGQSIYNVATAKEVSFNKTTVGTVITDSATGKITGLTAGEVSATSTDAINGSQLYATNKAIADSKTHYVSVNDDGVQADNYNNDGATGKNALAVGVGSKAAGENAVVIGYNNNVAQDKTVALGSSITTTQANSVVIGNESADRAATSESKVTILGQDYAFAGVGSASNGVVSVGKVGGERQIINVAAGQLSATSTDAVNGSQLYATNQAISSLQGQVGGAKSTVTEGKNTTITKTTNADGSTDYQVATKDDVSFDSVTVGNIKADAQSNKISGLADGEVSATSNEAVNGSQLHGTAKSVANVLGGNAKVNADGTVSTSNIGNTGKDNVHDAIASLQGQVAGSKTSVSAGKNTVVNSSTNADGSNNYQVALADDINLNSVTANQVTANQVKADHVIANQVMANQVNVGKVTIDGTSNKVSGLANGTISKDSTDAVNGSQLHQTNSNVAQYLGGGSTLNQDGSIKAPTYNVAGGSYNNVGDALGAVDTRVSNLEQAFYNTNKNVDDLRNDTYAGIAGAMAVGNLPQPTEAGMSMMSAGLSGYRGETAVAVGISAISDSNKIIWKMGASADSRSNIGGAVSVGYQWK